MEINKRPKVNTNLQHLRVKAKKSTSKIKSKNFEHPRVKAITFNIKK
jgi:SHS2 domain-containing protein